MHSIRSLAVVLIALVATACSSTALNAPVPAGNAATNASSKKHRAILRIVVPHRKHRRRLLIHGHYVSVSTKSIAIAVTPAAGGTAQNFNADLSVEANPNCNASSGSLVCNVPLMLALGHYTVTVATYDGALAGGNAPNNPPTGNELSANQSVPLTVSPAQVNFVSVTLDGIPVGVAIVPVAGSELTGDDTTGFALARCSQPAQNVDVYGVDADNNYIIGPGAPTPSLLSNDSTNLPVTATPGPSTPNQYTLTPPSYPVASTVVQLTAGVTPLAGVGGSSKSANVNVTIGSTTCYSITEYPAPASSPTGIAASSSNLWFTLGTSVGSISTSGTVAGPYMAGTGSIALAFDGTDMWVVNLSSGNVTKMGPTGSTLATYPVGSYPDAIAYDGAHMWVANSGGASVTELNSTGSTIGTYSVGSGPGAIAYDGADMWVANYSATPTGTVTKLSPAGATLGTYPVGYGPGGIAFDGTDMWVTNSRDGSITVLTPTGSPLHMYSIPTTGSDPGAITKGADGAMWFTELDGNNIGRVTSSGTFTEIPIPTSSSQPVGIVKGPDGNMWFTEKAGDKIGVVLTH